MKSIKFIIFIIYIFTSSSVIGQTYNIIGKVEKVFVGADDWYGVRFYITPSADNTGEHCISQFAYTEPTEGSQHQTMVSIFLAGYLAGKTLNLTVTPGRNNYCRIIEGSIDN